MPKKSSTASSRKHWGNFNELASGDSLIKPKMKRMSATAIQDRNANDATLNAVIIYDTLVLAGKAKATLERGRTDQPTRWHVKPWRVDMLKLPQAADVTLTEAAEAHLMLLTVRAGSVVSAVAVGQA